MAFNLFWVNRTKGTPLENGHALCSTYAIALVRKPWKQKIKYYLVQILPCVLPPHHSSMLACVSASTQLSCRMGWLNEEGKVDGSIEGIRGLLVPIMAWHGTEEYAVFACWKWGLFFLLLWTSSPFPMFGRYFFRTSVRTLQQFLPMMVSRFYLTQEIILPVLFPSPESENERLLQALHLKTPLLFYLKRILRFRKDKALLFWGP